MSVGTPYKIANEATSVTSDTNASITTNALAHAGDTVFVWCATRLINKGVISTISGPTGGTVELNTFINSGVILAISIARIRLTADYASASTLTVTLDLASTRKVTGAFAVPGLGDANVDVSATNTGTTGTPTAGATSASHHADAIAIAVWANDGSAATDTGTPGGSYTEIGDTTVGTSSWCSGYAEYLVLSSTGAQTATYTPSVTPTHWSGIIGVWQGTSAVTQRKPYLQAVNRAATY